MHNLKYCGLPWKLIKLPSRILKYVMTNGAVLKGQMSLIFFTGLGHSRSATDIHGKSAASTHQILYNFALFECKLQWDVGGHRITELSYMGNIWTWMNEQDMERMHDAKLHDMNASYKLILLGGLNKKE